MEPLVIPSNETDLSAQKAIALIDLVEENTAIIGPSIPSVVSPIHRGVESSCHKVTVSDTDYFLKIRFNDMACFFDNAAVAEATLLAGENNIGPKLISSNPEHGVFLLEHLDNNWSWGKLDNFKNQQVLENTVKSKKAFHNLKPLSNSLSVFDKIEQYLQFLDQHNIHLPKTVYSQKKQIEKIKLALSAAGISKKPCHGDGVASNIMISKDDRVKLVDFDMAGNMDPYYDLGSLILEITQFDEHAKEIIEIYEGQYRVEILNRCFLYSIADDFMWSLWAFICAKESARKEIEFSKYAQWRLLRSQWNISRQDFSNLLHKL